MRRFKSSGLLVDRIGGPSVNPYTPGDCGARSATTAARRRRRRRSRQDHGEKLVSTLALYLLEANRAAAEHGGVRRAESRDLHDRSERRPPRRCRRSCC